MSETPRAPTSPISFGAHWALAWGGLLSMASGVGIGRFVYTPILPPMAQALELSKSGAGLIASANYAGYFCGALLAATLRMPGSRRAWLLGALFMGGITTILMGIATAMPWFLLLRFLGGMASALVLIHASALVLEQLGQIGQPRMIALHFAGVGFGIAVSAIAVTLLLAAGKDWRWLWFAGGGLSLLATGAVAMLVPDRDAPTPAGPAAAGAMTRALRRMALAYGLFGFGYVITATFIVSIIRTTPAIQTLEPVIWVIVGLAAAPSVLLWGALARWIGVPAGFALAALTEAAGVLASVAWQSATGIILAAILLGGTFMGLTALGLMRARELSPGAPRRAMALLTGCFGIGQIIGPVFAGVLYDRLGDLSVASALAAVALAAAAALAVVRPPRPTSR